METQHNKYFSLNKKQLIRLNFSVVVAILLIITVTLYYYLQNSYTYTKVLPYVVTDDSYHKKNFEGNLPPIFLSEIPLEKGILLEQSYGLEYASETQSSIEFYSIKTVKENLVLYTIFLDKEKWRTVSFFQSEKLSSLYAKKENKDIGITISKATSSVNAAVRSKVSINFLQK